MLLLLWHEGCVADKEPRCFEGKIMESTELRIEPRNTNIVNEYRLNEGRLEMRVRDRSGDFYPAHGTAWRLLTQDELNSHIALNTVVAQWMSSKIWRAAQN
jgi:hypothetical protein